MSKLAFDCTRKALGIDGIIFASDYPYECLSDMMKYMDSLKLFFPYFFKIFEFKNIAIIGFATINIKKY